MLQFSFFSTVEAVSVSLVPAVNDTINIKEITQNIEVKNMSGRKKCLNYFS